MGQQGPSTGKRKPLNPNIKVDPEDLPLVRQYSWYLTKRKTVTYASAYAWAGEKDHRKIYLHRLIMGFPKEQVDHINGDGLDCRKENLRTCTTSQNRRNQAKTRGFSRFKGVGWHKGGQCWRAYLTIGRKQIHLGHFKDEVDAAQAYNLAAAMEFGEFARFNVPLEVTQ